MLLPEQALTLTLSHGSPEEIFVFVRGRSWALLPGAEAVMAEGRAAQVCPAGAREMWLLWQLGLGCPAAAQGVVPGAGCWFGSEFSALCCTVAFCSCPLDSVAH